MIHYPYFNPIALQIGPLQIHWYGLMYVVGFVSAWVLALYRARNWVSQWTSEQASDLIFYGALGVVIGGRVGYMLIYNLPGLLADPLSLFKVWQGGMSFHGGLIGVAIAMWVYARHFGKTYFEVTDFLVPLVPLGLGAGRLGNFINAELWGRITDLPWGMIFPNGGPLPRHPSQLYEFFLEGIVLFTIIWIYSSRPRPRMAVTAMFLLCYGCVRFFAEFFREPDPQFGYIAFNWLTMGQLLSVPMILFGMWLLKCAYRREMVEG